MNHGNAVPSVQTFAEFDAAFKRVSAGVADEWDKVLDKNKATFEDLSGIWEWFKNNHSQKWQGLKDCEAKIDELWLSGRPYKEAQEEFNAQLRIYRNGHVWLIEKYLAAKKEQVGKPAQGKLI